MIKLLFEFHVHNSDSSHFLPKIFETKNQAVVYLREVYAESLTQLILPVESKSTLFDKESHVILNAYELPLGKVYVIQDLQYLPVIKQCDCDCHSSPNMMHMFPCCDRTYEQFEKNN